MIEKHLEQIRTREGEAENRVLSAGKEAEMLVDQAREAGEKLLEETRLQWAERKRSLLAGAQQEAEDKITVLRRENAEKMAALSMAAADKKEQALNLILRTFRDGL